VKLCLAYASSPTQTSGVYMFMWLMSALAVKVVVQLGYTILACKSGQSGKDAARVADLIA
jgi:hypothetical protein